VRTDSEAVPGKRKLKLPFEPDWLAVTTLATALRLSQCLEYIAREEPLAFRKRTLSSPWQSVTFLASQF
jgi:hypothetical protein